MYKNAMFTLALSGMFVFAGSGIMSAQPKPSSSTTSNHHKVTRQWTHIEGCLVKGDEAGEYSMKVNGKLYGLTSRRVRMANHVGQTVAIHGYITPESAESAEPNEKGPETGGDIDVTVTSLKTISKTCKM